jgi:signal transduction histidine kinase
MLLLAIARSADPDAALEAMAEGGVRAAWISATGEVLADGGVHPGPGALELAGGASTAQLLPEAEGAPLVVVPLPGGERLLLAAREGGLGDDPEECSRIGEEFARLLERGERLRALEQEMGELRQRAEESEALHVLGLSANRTLDAADVVSLVARFARSLVGGNYVTVTVGLGDGIRTVKRAGVRSPDFPERDPLAAAVIGAGKPVVVPPAPPDLELGAHLAEGMRAALGVPMTLYGESIGALVVGYRRSYEPSARDVRLALTLAGHAAVALQNAQLHGELASRTDELERAYAELRRSSESRERFFATLSHELRTPLNSTLGYLDLVLDEIHGPVPERIRRPLKNASRAAKGLLHLVSDVLDLAKMDAGKIELSLHPCSIAAVVREAVATVQPLASARALPVELSMEESLPLLLTDADRVRQIMINLLSNAIKFTAEGRVGVRVRRSETRIFIEVTDSGTGIAPEHHERIFHEFEQVGDAAEGGTGLGLAISRKLARLLGGDVQVESMPGEGSTFTFHLPLAQGTAVAP